MAIWYHSDVDEWQDFLQISSHQCFTWLLVKMIETSVLTSVQLFYMSQNVNVLHQAQIDHLLFSNITM